MKRYMKCVMVVCMAIFFIGGCGRDTEVINISKDCYEFFSEENLAEVTSYFYSKYKVDLNTTNKKWDNGFEGEVPKNILKVKTFEDIAKFEVINQLCEKYSIDAPKNFEDLNNRHNLFNQKRNMKKEAGEVIYGPVEMELKEFYFNTYANLEIALQEELLKQLFKPTESELQSFFDEIKSDLQQEYTGKVTTYIISNSYTLQEKKTIDVFSEIEQRLENNTEIPILELGDKYCVDIYEKKLEINTEGVSKEDYFTQSINYNFCNMVVGDISEIMKVGEYIGIIKVDEKVELGCGTLEENMYLVKVEYAKQKYNEYLIQLISDEINCIRNLLLMF